MSRTSKSKSRTLFQLSQAVAAPLLGNFRGTKLVGMRHVCVARLPQAIRVLAPLRGRSRGSWSWIPCDHPGSAKRITPREKSRREHCHAESGKGKWSERNRPAVSDYSSASEQTDNDSCQQ
jgi:hypothetical protein